jgi:MFS family permease
VQQLDGLTRRVIASHGIAALAVALPWPLLLVLVHERTEDPLLLGLVGAARLLPYVAVSWATARLADAMRRDLIVRVTLVLRATTLAATAVAVLADHVWLAVAACTLAVAVGTPAYPAQVAAMPGIAGPLRLRATDLLVTIEVAAFVVGAALGGFLLHPATRGLLPWVPVAMTLVALAMILGVSMPTPVRGRGDAHRLSPSAALRAAPPARRAIAVMAAVNLVIALVAVALLPIAVDTWSSDAAGYGVATGVLGFAAFGAPLLRRLGRSAEHSVGWGLALLAVGLVLVVPAPSLGWALPALTLAGAAAVSIEAGATAVLQEHVPDEVRASVLGLNDTVIIAAALVGSLVAPVAVALVGAAVLLGGLATTVLLVAWWARPARHPVPDQMRATVLVTLLETDETARPGVTRVVDRPARRAALRRERVRVVRWRHRRVPVAERVQRPAESAAVRRTR